jgi:hypothetical protein
MVSMDLKPSKVSAKFVPIKALAHKRSSLRAPRRLGENWFGQEAVAFDV